MGIISRLFRGPANVIKRPIRKIPTWVDLDRHKEVSKNLLGRFQELLRPIQPKRKETFEEAVKRQRISKKALRDMQFQYFMIAITFLILGVIVFIYCLYHLSNLHFRGAFVSLGLMSLILTMAFRYHFWYIQIKHRRLGFTLMAWLKTFLGGQS